MPDEPASLEAPTATPSSRRRHPWVRFAILVVIIVSGALIAHFSPLHDYVTNRQLLVAEIEGLRATWWTPLALIGAYLILSPLAIPISPLVLAGGLIFGTLRGATLNLVGLMLGASVSFSLAKILGREAVERLGFERLRRVERILQERSFWLLLRIRLLPIPFPIVNFGAAMAGVPFPLFFLTSLLGLAPANFVYTYLAAALVEATGAELRWALVKVAIAIVAMFSITFLLPRLLDRRAAKVL